MTAFLDIYAAFLQQHRHKVMLGFFKHTSE